MNQFQEITIHLEGIGTLLKNRKFSVPAYQRSFSWEKEHIHDLLNDINDAIENKEKQYFIGSIVVTGSLTNRLDVVDGQQRLTTTSLIISAIKDKFKNDGDHQAEQSIKSDFLSKTDRKTKEIEPRLTLNEIDNDIYQQIIEDYALISIKDFPRKSNKRLYDSYKYIQEYIEEITSKSKDSEELLHSWIDFIENNLKAILVATPDDSNAFIIFETLNDRGLELAISDLLKNYIFHKSGDKIEESKNRWQSMIAVLESTSDDPLVVTYIRHFAMSKYGLIREKELFSSIKKKINSKRSAIDFANRLNNEVRIYSALINTDHEYWDQFNSDVREHIKTINTLGVSQLRPLLMALLNNINSKEINSYLKYLVSLAVRYLHAGTAGSGTLERIYSDAAKFVTEKKINSLSDLKELFINAPTDAQFFNYFKNSTISKASIARYYLKEIENHKNKSHKMAQSPTLDAKKLNLEHILPQNPSKNWETKISLEQSKAHYKRLGNMTLIESKTNSTIGNECFNEKKKYYKDSIWAITNELNKYEKWDIESIEKRQEEMANFAVKIWAI